MKTTTKVIYNALTTCMFASLVLSPTAEAVSPAPDGGYPGGNTAEGQNALLSQMSGVYNVAVGWLSLESLTTGTANTGVGAGTLALNNGDRNTATGAGALLFNSSGADNTASGALALFYNTAEQNCAFGSQALFSNTSGPGNTAMGYQALFSNTGANANAAFGAYTLQNNTDGNFNTAIGFAALQSNTTGVENTANGSGALLLNTTGSYNTAAGLNALINNTEGSTNSAFGWGALSANTIQDFSTAIGYQALFSNTAGGNTAVGAGALENSTTGINNTAIGSAALFSNITGSSNTVIGEEAGYFSTGSGNVYIGAAVDGVADDNNTIRIADNLPNEAGQSACYVGGIAGQTVDPSGAGQVYVDNAGKLGVFLSSQRFKRDVEPMNRASEAILALKPVTFHYKNDAKNTPCFGLIAEEVANIHPALVVRDKEGKPYSVRYDQVNAMLLNEFLKEHRKVQELEAALAAVNEHLKAQDAKIDKVNAKLELNGSAPQMTVNDP